MLSDPQCIERQVIGYTLEGRLTLEKEVQTWLEYQKSQGREYSVIVSASIECPILAADCLTLQPPPLPTQYIFLDNGP